MKQWSPLVIDGREINVMSTNDYDDAPIELVPDEEYLRDWWECVKKAGGYNMMTVDDDGYVKSKWMPYNEWVWFEGRWGDEDNAE